MKGFATYKNATLILMKEVYAGKSAICGEGLFIKEHVASGERICYIKGTRKYKINKDVNDALSYPDWIGISKHTWIDPAMPYKRLNHSCNPNSSIKGSVTLYALRPIKANEELTIDYSTIEGDMRWVLEGGATCKCGERNCRKIIKSIHFLPRKQFQVYLPYVPTYFRELYQRLQQQKTI